MGNEVSKYFLPHLWREDEPDSFAPIKYDPQFGFDDVRKEKTVPVKEIEMDSANLEMSVRDFCAHLRIEFRGCVRDNNPFWYRCKGLYNELSDCYLKERIHDMKEFEREKRLNARESRLASQASS